MSIAVRAAQLSDLPQLSKMNSCLVDDQGSENPFSLKEYEDRFREWLDTNIWTVDVFLHDGQVIGYSVYQERADYYDPNEAVIYIRQYYIKRAHRRLGMGKAAFQILIDTRFPKHVQSIALDVMATNSAGQNFWKKMGFNEYFISMKKEVLTSRVRRQSTESTLPRNHGHDTPHNQNRSR